MSKLKQINLILTLIEFSLYNNLYLFDVRQ